MLKETNLRFVKLHDVKTLSRAEINCNSRKYFPVFLLQPKALLHSGGTINMNMLKSMPSDKLTTTYLYNILFRDLLLNSKIRTGWGEDFTIMSD
jgi:hypothetical protein